MVVEVVLAHLLSSIQRLFKLSRGGSTCFCRPSVCLFFPVFRWVKFSVFQPLLLMFSTSLFIIFSFCSPSILSSLFIPRALLERVRVSLQPQPPPIVGSGSSLELVVLLFLLLVCSLIIYYFHIHNSSASSLAFIYTPPMLFYPSRQRHRTVISGGNDNLLFATSSSSPSCVCRLLLRLFINLLIYTIIINH